MSKLRNSGKALAIILAITLCCGVLTAIQLTMRPINGDPQKDPLDEENIVTFEEGDTFRWNDGYHAWSSDSESWVWYYNETKAEEAP